MFHRSSSLARANLRLLSRRSTQQQWVCRRGRSLRRSVRRLRLRWNASRKRASKLRSRRSYARRSASAKKNGNRRRSCRLQTTSSRKSKEGKRARMHLSSERSLGRSARIRRWRRVSCPTATASVKSRSLGTSSRRSGSRNRRRCRTKRLRLHTLTGTGADIDERWRCARATRLDSFCTRCGSSSGRSFESCAPQAPKGCCTSKRISSSHIRTPSPSSSPTKHAANQDRSSISMYTTTSEWCKMHASKRMRVTQGKLLSGTGMKRTNPTSLPHVGSCTTRPKITAGTLSTDRRLTDDDDQRRSHPTVVKMCVYYDNISTTVNRHRCRHLRSAQREKE
mmetsp:Transcript_4085/g.14283  ORF Transcript_4085/g.14283 Transcript_4085/m.14283 type:complete len:337 (-) Transcript_4085:677-1687(-)